MQANYSTMTQQLPLVFPGLNWNAALLYCQPEKPAPKYALSDSVLRGLALAVCAQAMCEASSSNNRGHPAAAAAADETRAAARAWLLRDDVWVWFEVAGMPEVDPNDLMRWVEDDCPTCGDLREYEPRGAGPWPRVGEVGRSIDKTRTRNYAPERLL